MIAIKIRKVKIPPLDDARYVVITVYVATTLSVLIAVVSLPLFQYQNTSAAIYAGSSIIGAAIYLILLFLPKVKECLCLNVLAVCVITSPDLASFSFKCGTFMADLYIFYFLIKQMVILYRDPQGRKIFKSTDISTLPRISSTTEFSKDALTTSAHGLTSIEHVVSSEVLSSPVSFQEI